jgi:hypothetical protein
MYPHIKPLIQIRVAKGNNQGDAPNNMPVSSSTIGYLMGIFHPQLTHFPRSQTQEKSGTLWNHLMFLPHDGQWLGFVTTLRFSDSSFGSL